MFILSLFSCWTWLLIALIFAYILFKKDPKPIFNIYKQPGKWFWIKYAVFRSFLLIRKWKIYRDRENGIVNEDGERQFFSHLSTPKELEKPQPLSDLPQAFDAVFFIAVAQDGHYIICGSERRHHGVSNGPLYIVIPDKGIFCHLKTPDTILFGAGKDQYGAEGLTMKMVEPMKKWTVTFSGKMKKYDDPSQVVDVTLDATFTSSLPFFNFDTDLSTHALARAIALEDWSLKYFENLKKVHQTHYEQMGQMDATVTIGSDKIDLKSMGTFRDHSFGQQRDWDLMHRYVMFMIFLENGIKITIGVVCHPLTQSELLLGYIVFPSGEIHAIEWTDFKLYQHGEKGTYPRDHAFQFRAGNVTYTVQANVYMDATHYVGWRWQAKMIHRFVKYEVNGMKGRGISEFNYANKDGRPEEYAKNDPDWFKKLEK